MTKLRDKKATTDFPDNYTRKQRKIRCKKYTLRMHE